MPTPTEVQAEIAAAEAQLDALRHCWPREAGHDAEVRAARARLQAAEEHDAARMTSLRARHVRRLAEYEAAGNKFYAEEHRQGIARCDAALARLAQDEQVAA